MNKIWNHLLNFLLFGIRQISCTQCTQEWNFNVFLTATCRRHIDLYLATALLLGNGNGARSRWYKKILLQSKHYRNHGRVLESYPMRFRAKLIKIMYAWCVCFGTAIRRVSIPLFIPGPRLNIKTVLSMYGDFHVKDKTAVRTSYL